MTIIEPVLALSNKRESMVETLSQVDTARVLCVDQSLLRKLATAGQLVKAPQNGRVPYAKTSVVAYLAQPGVLFHTTPEEWCAICLEPDSEIISLPEMTRRYGISEYARRNVLDSRAIPYIKAPGGIHLPARFVEAIVADLQWFTYSQLMHLFNISKGMARRWITDRALCNHPVTEERCPRTSCIRDYIAHNATHPSIDPGDWWQAMADGVQLATDEEAIDLLGKEAFEEAVQSGELVGIVLPPFRHSLVKQRRFLPIQNYMRCTCISQFTVRAILCGAM